MKGSVRTQARARTYNIIIFHILQPN